MGKNDFFLEPDDAQTMGDINYMRKSVRVRRTFPKTLKNRDGFAVEKQVSATEDFSLSDRNNSFQNQSNNFYTAPAKSIPSESKQTTSSETTFNQSNSAKPAKTDTNMNMFLNMARKIKKGK